MRTWSYARILALGFVLAGLLACGSCKRKPATPEPSTEPTLRLYLVSTMAGALEPCGCQKDMLGGIDHMAHLVRTKKPAVANPLLLAAGPTMFMDPKLESKKRAQDEWKAEAIAASLKALNLAAWTPGCNDWAAGGSRLGELARATGAVLLGANLEASKELKGALPLVPSHVTDVNGQKVGIAGVSIPKHRGALPAGVQAGDATKALAEAKKGLESAGAKILIALVALDRGEALRLVEAVPGFHVMVIGKPSDEGEGNDAPTPPVLVGRTLVVQPPNHLQAVAVVDLFVREGSFDFVDGSGLDVAEQRRSLESRISSLEKRIAEWESKKSVSAEDLAARRKDLASMKAELEKLVAPAPPRTASFFRYELEQVKESVGTDDAVAGRMAGYYKRVNEHNKKAFADRLPPKVSEGQSHYVGAEECSGCHGEAHDFWKKTRHAKAYATLSEQFKEFNLDCVSCHVTGYEEPGGSTVTHVQRLMDVQCETCHGAGSKHAESSDAKDIQPAPNKDVCASKCHHPPHVGPEWSVDEAWKGIIGPGHGLPVK